MDLLGQPLKLEIVKIEISDYTISLQCLEQTYQFVMLLLRIEHSIWSYVFKRMYK